MKIAKTRNVKTPRRGTMDSAGIDFFIPVIDRQFEADFYDKNTKRNAIIYDQTIVIQPDTRVIIPLGIRVNFEDYPLTALVAFNRSGLSSKRGLMKLAEVVDIDYQGEVFVSLYNSNNYPVEVKSGDAIIQFLHIPLVASDINEVSVSEIWTKETERGKGCLGSTSKA